MPRAVKLDRRQGTGVGADRELLVNEQMPGHIPVLLNEVIEWLAVRPGGQYIDATFGGGGHTRALLQASAPDGRVLAVDADPEAVERARVLAGEYPGRLVVGHSNFADLAQLAPAAGFAKVDGVLFDLGLSSLQLADPERGFSFQQPGPLDMRFDPTRGEPAAALVNTLPEERLADILWRYGEEPRARTIAKAIVRARQQRPLTTTTELAEVVARVVGRAGQRIHPATRTFQALRIAVNGELDALAGGLDAAISLLRPGGRLVVIAFHSLEDRIVKQTFRAEAQGCRCPPGTPVCICGHRPRLRILTPHPIFPSAAEVARNPRSRSARLRAAERLP